MIFSAGLGTRFKPWTDRHPKALALVNGKSLLQRNIEYLQEFGIREIIVNVHHFGEQVIEILQKNKGWGSRVMISDEKDELLDTGGGLLKARGLFSEGEQFITCNADILTDLNINRLIEFHKRNKPLISLGVTSRKTARYLLFDKDNRLCGWRNINSRVEKLPLPHHPLIEKAYSSVALFEYAFFNHLRLTGKFSLIDAYLELAGNHRILGFDHSGDRWVDVGRPESVAVAENLFP